MSAVQNHDWRYASLARRMWVFEHGSVKINMRIASAQLSTDPLILRGRACE